MDGRGTVHLVLCQSGHTTKERPRDSHGLIGRVIGSTPCHFLSRHTDWLSYFSNQIPGHFSNNTNRAILHSREMDRPLGLETHKLIAHCCCRLQIQTISLHFPEKSISYWEGFQEYIITSSEPISSPRGPCRVYQPLRY